MINAGTTVNIAKVSAGNANPPTTLDYAKQKDAEVIRAGVKLDY